MQLVVISLALNHIFCLLSCYRKNIDFSYIQLQSKVNLNPCFFPQFTLKDQFNIFQAKEVLYFCTAHEL